MSAACGRYTIIVHSFLFCFNLILLRKYLDLSSEHCSPARTMLHSRFFISIPVGPGMAPNTMPRSVLVNRVNEGVKE